MLFDWLRGGERDNFIDMYEIIIGFARTIVDIYILSNGMGICLSNVLSMRPTVMNRCIKRLHCSLLCTKHELYAILHRSHSPSLSWRICLALSCCTRTIR